MPTAVRMQDSRVAPVKRSGKTSGMASRAQYQAGGVGSTESKLCQEDLLPTNLSPGISTMDWKGVMSPKHWTKCKGMVEEAETISASFILSSRRGRG